MRKQSIKVKLAATFFGLLLTTCAFAAQEGLTKRVRFARGRTTATLKNSVVRGTVDRYTLGARAGQKMSVSITSVERNAVFTIYTPGGGTLEGAGEGQDASNWSGELPASGDYVIEVGGTRGNATYTLKVTVR
ncbi:MAG TPA: hypothetical protein VGB76_10030 [Pyrinomonadaceae bacterium]|jgi:uncharacterized membrane protein (UPF0136 family)